MSFDTLLTLQIRGSRSLSPEETMYPQRARRPSFGNEPCLTRSSSASTNRTITPNASTYRCARGLTQVIDVQSLKAAVSEEPELIFARIQSLIAENRTLTAQISAMTVRNETLGKAFDDAVTDLKDANKRIAQLEDLNRIKGDKEVVLMTQIMRLNAMGTQHDTPGFPCGGQEFRTLQTPNIEAASSQEQQAYAEGLCSTNLQGIQPDSLSVESCDSQSFRSSPQKSSPADTDGIELSDSQEALTGATSAEMKEPGTSEMEESFLTNASDASTLAASETSTASDLIDMSSPNKRSPVKVSISIVVPSGCFSYADVVAGRATPGSHPVSASESYFPSDSCAVGIAKLDPSAQAFIPSILTPIKDKGKGIEGADSVHGEVSDQYNTFKSVPCDESLYAIVQTIPPHFRRICPFSLCNEEPCPVKTCDMKYLCQHFNRIDANTKTSHWLGVSQYSHSNNHKGKNTKTEGVGSCGKKGCKDVHEYRTCTLNADEKECAWATLPKNQMGGLYNNAMQKIHYEKRVHKGKRHCAPEEWKVRMTIAGLRDAHAEGRYNANLSYMA